MGASTATDGGRVVPKTMVEALECDDPCLALTMISLDSQERATRLSEKLLRDIESSEEDEQILPDLLKRLPNTKDADSHPVATAIACSDSILNSLTKIASGGSQASQEIIQLEHEKRELELDVVDVETALRLRICSDRASQSLSARRFREASLSIQEYTQLQQKHRLTKRARAYAGEYTVTQLETTKQALREQLLQDYQQAVAGSDLRALGTLTPMLQMVQLETEAVGLYLRFLKGILAKELTAAAATALEGKPPPPYIPMGKVYNAAVTILRHHLPMVSHCMHRADGDAALIRLVHSQIEDTVLPLFEAYVSNRQLERSARNAQRIYGTLESILVTDIASAETESDAGFSREIGSLSDVDASMEEAVLCLQHAETYTRFVQHTVREVHKARELRYTKEQEESKMEQDRNEWTTGMKQDAAPHDDYAPIEILPPHTALEEKLAEVGGNYAAIESCLLLASVQRALAMNPEDSRHYSALGLKSGGAALKTSIVESSLYAARRGAQRAFATGHTGTAAAVANYFADCLNNILVQVLVRRAEDLGVNLLKPGEGLLEGSAGIFGAYHLKPQAAPVEDERQRKQHIEQGISRACATLNDLELAGHHTKELERLLSKNVEQGFPPQTPETEQLKVCVRSLEGVGAAFGLASDQSIESLLSVLKPRIRAIVTDAVGSDHSTQAAAAVGGFMGATKTGAPTTQRMNYELDEDAYKLLEVSESYVSRLCTLLDEILLPLCRYLAPRLADTLVLGVLGTVSKRLEVSLKKSRFTALGALSLDSDMRDLIHYAKDRLVSSEYNSSNIALCNACTPLSRLLQIARLMSLDDLEDVLDLISSSKRKGNWDLKPEDSRSYLSLRVEFDAELVGQLLRAADEE